MKFVDHVTISVTSGHGGAGASTFRREKYVPMGGPDGGSGGNGGDVILRASSKLQTLMDLTLKRRYAARPGERGRGKKQSGTNGEACIIDVPRGTMVFDENDILIADLVEENAEVTVARGGKGGRGNSLFATSTNQAPLYSQPGLPEETSNLRLELRLIAQVGLVGLPNAGKSTLLKSLTKANPKIADYPFTTLYPNLGVLKFDDQEIVIADIPGLIEGASEGVGLGIEFLRHIDRTKLVIHVIAFQFEGADAIFTDYQTVRDELEKSEIDLNSKHTILVLNKSDLADEESISETVAYFEKKGVTLCPISAISRRGLSDLSSQIRHSWSTL